MESKDENVQNNNYKTYEFSLFLRLNSYTNFFFLQKNLLSYLLLILS